VLKLLPLLPLLPLLLAQESLQQESRAAAR